MTEGTRDVAREVLPIPDRRRPGPVTYDAKDPETSYPPIEPLRDDDNHHLISPEERMRVAMTRQ